MNRVISDNLEAINPGVLPPREREGPARILFLSGQTHGLKSNGDEMIKATAERDDVDCVHVRLRPTPAMKLLMGRVPGPIGRGVYDLAVTRRRWAWKRLIVGWLRGPLPLDRFDAVHVITRSHCAGVAEELTRRDPGRRTVLALSVDATAPADRHEFGPTSPWQDRLDMIAERAMYARVDLVQCRSRWAERSIREDFGLERPPDTFVVPPSITMPPRARVPFVGDAERPLRLGFCGNPWARKGGPRLIRWFADRWQDRAELHVVCRNAKIPDGVRNVYHTERLPRDELFERFYPKLDVFVLPAYRDQTPWVLAEAASAGVPCVGPRQCGIIDIVRDGQTGLLRHREDDAGLVEAVETLMNDRALIDRMGAAARAHAEANLNRERNYPAFIDRFLALIDERRGAVAVA